MASHSAQRGCNLGNNRGRGRGCGRSRSGSSSIGFHTHEREQQSSDLSKSDDQSGDDLLRLSSSEARSDTDSSCLEVQHCTIADNMSNALNATTTSRKLFEDDLER